MYKRQQKMVRPLLVLSGRTDTRRKERNRRVNCWLFGPASTRQQECNCLRVFVLTLVRTERQGLQAQDQNAQPFSLAPDFSGILCRVPSQEASLFPVRSLIPGALRVFQFGSHFGVFCSSYFCLKIRSTVLPSVRSSLTASASSHSLISRSIRQNRSAVSLFIIDP